MKKTAELDREPITVDYIEFAVTEIVWDNGGRSFDVYIDGGLLTENGSLDHYPTEHDVRFLYDQTDADTFPSATCVCGEEIIRTPDGWQHNVAPWFWGNDHDPDPTGGTPSRTTNEFEPVLAGIEWTKDRATAEVAALDDEARSLLTDALRAQRDTEADTQVLSIIRDRLAQTENGSEAVAVVFCAFDYDNGWFLDTNGEIFYRDGSTEDVDFPINDQLTEIYGRVAEQALLGLNLRTGEFSYEDTDPDSVYDDLGVPRPGSNVLAEG